MFKQFVESGKKARRQFIQGLIDDGKCNDALVYYCINALLEDLRNARELVLNVDFRWLDDANLMLKLNSRTVIEFKTGNRCFVPKRCIFNY
jgi:hypothetical protein